MKWLLLFPLYTILVVVSVVSVWHIDVCFGAMSINGCVTNGVNCLDPMVVYHHYLRILIGSLMIKFTLTSFLIGALIHKKAVGESQRYTIFQG